MRTRDLKWHQLLTLNELYKRGKTSAATLGDYFRHLRAKSHIGYKTGNKSITEARPTFYPYYERHHLADFERFHAFLAEANLEDDGKRRYNEWELVTLMLIHKQRDELRANLTTGATLASKMFGSSKYLTERPGLEAAVLQILDIEAFPDRDPKNFQWRCVVDCLSPDIIVLCENLTYLKLPWVARGLNVELWYVGGNNIAMIDSIAPEKLALPVYYSCDWDHHGLHIFSRIRRKLLARGFHLSLLFPHETSSAMPEKSPHHYSFWDADAAFSGFAPDDFTEKQSRLITHLITNRQWIEEQSQDLTELLLHNNAIAAGKVAGG